MAPDSRDTPKPASDGLLGALGLSPVALLLVALLALLVWWYFQDEGMPLTAWETAFVVFAVAAAAAAARAVFAVLRRLLKPASRKPGGAPK